MSKIITDEALLAAIKASAAGEPGALQILKEHFKCNTFAELPHDQRAAFLSVLGNSAKPLKVGDPLPDFDWHHPQRRVNDPNAKQARKLEQQVNEEERRRTGGNRYKISGIDD